MANAVGRTQCAILENNSGGAVARGDVVVIDDTQAKSFKTTTTGGFVNGQIGVVLDSSIADNALGLIAFSGWVPQINLQASASLGQFVKTHTVAKQGTAHAVPSVAGDFAMVLETGTTPSAILFGLQVQPIHDPTAIHTDVDGEIDGLTEKTTPVAGDWVLIEDSEDGLSKKKVDIDTLLGGGGGGGGGSNIFISETSVTSGASLVVTGIDDTYQEYELDVDMKPATDNVSWRIEFSTDGGSTWLSSGYKHAGSVYYSNAFSGVTSSNSESILSFGEAGNDTGEHVAICLKFMNPRTTNQQLVSMDAMEITHQPYLVKMIASLFNSTASKINAIRFTFSSGNIASGVARLYGIKNT